MPVPNKSKEDVRKLAAAHTNTCINVLVGLVRSPKVSPSVRERAANSLLDRAHGKAAQVLEGGDNPLQVNMGMDDAGLENVARRIAFVLARHGNAPQSLSGGDLTATSTKLPTHEHGVDERIITPSKGE